MVSEAVDQRKQLQSDMLLVKGWILKPALGWSAGTSPVPEKAPFEALLARVLLRFASLFFWRPSHHPLGECTTILRFQLNPSEFSKVCLTWLGPNFSFCLPRLEYSKNEYSELQPLNIMLCWTCWNLVLTYEVRSEWHELKLDTHVQAHFSKISSSQE